jgi:hypothetical protein
MPPDQVIDIPVDQLGLLILNDLLRTNEWNEYNYLLGAQRGYKGDAALAITEAMAWLRARALIARTPGQTSDARRCSAGTWGTLGAYQRCQANARSGKARRVLVLWLCVLRRGEGREPQRDRHANRLLYRDAMSRVLEADR